MRKRLLSLIASGVLLCCSAVPVMADTIIIAEPPAAQEPQYVEPVTHEVGNRPVPVERSDKNPYSITMRPVPVERSDKNPYSITMSASVPAQITAPVTVEFTNIVDEITYYIELQSDEGYKNSGYLPKGIYEVEKITLPDYVAEDNYVINTPEPDYFKLNEEKPAYMMQIEVEGRLEEEPEPVVKERNPELEKMRQDMYTKAPKQTQIIEEEPETVVEAEPVVEETTVEEVVAEPIEEEVVETEYMEEQQTWRRASFTSKGGANGITVDGISNGRYRFVVTIKHSGKLGEATLRYSESETGFLSETMPVEKQINLVLDDGFDTGLKLHCDDVKYVIDDSYTFDFSHEYPMTKPTSAPEIMLTGESTSDMDVVIKIIEGGVYGKGTYQVSSDGGKNWNTERRIDNKDASIGSITINFSKGTYSAGDEYTAHIVGAVEKDNFMLIVAIIGVIVAIVGAVGFVLLQRMKAGKDSYRQMNYDDDEEYEDDDLDEEDA